MNETSLAKAVRFLDRVVNLCAVPGKIFAWLILGIVVLSIITIIASLFRVHVFAQWTNPVFLFGSELNSTSLQELQWHLFAIMMMFAGAYTYAQDRHVRVDVLYSRMPAKMKQVVNILGDLLFMVPFAIIIIRYCYNLVSFSYIVHEASSEMGLTHRWVIKTVVPLGMSLIAIQGVAHGVAGIIRLIGMCLNIPVDKFAIDEDQENEC